MFSSFLLHKLTWVWPGEELPRGLSLKETSASPCLWSESGNSPPHLHPWGHMTMTESTKDSWTGFFPPRYSNFEFSMLCFKFWFWNWCVSFVCTRLEVRLSGVSVSLDSVVKEDQEVRLHNRTECTARCFCKSFTICQRWMSPGDGTWQEVMWWDGWEPTTGTPVSDGWTASWRNCWICRRQRDHLINVYSQSDDSVQLACMKWEIRTN